jgi:hypothetical protein
VPQGLVQQHAGHVGGRRHLRGDDVHLALKGEAFRLPGRALG